MAKWGSAGNNQASRSGSAPYSTVHASPGGGVFLLFLLIRVAADGDDTDGGAGGVRDDNRLSLSLPRGAGGHVTPPTGDWGAAGWAVVHHGTPWGSVLLDTLGSLRGAGSLWRGHLTGGDISVMTKQHILTEKTQTLYLHPRGPNFQKIPDLPNLHRKKPESQTNWPPSVTEHVVPLSRGL